MKAYPIQNCLFLLSLVLLFGCGDSDSEAEPINDEKNTEDDITDQRDGGVALLDDVNDTEQPKNDGTPQVGSSATDDQEKHVANDGKDYDTGRDSAYQNDIDSEAAEPPTSKTGSELESDPEPMGTSVVDGGVGYDEDSDSFFDVDGGEIDTESVGTDVADIPCTTVSTQTIDVPIGLSKTGGTMEVRGIRNTSTSHSAEIVWVEELAIEPLTSSIEVAVDESDFQFVLFSDIEDNLIDGQIHQTSCDAARPKRGKAVLNVPDQYETIQEAVDAASPGDTVLVAPGTYTEETIRLKPSILLIGSGADNTILDGEGEATKLIDVSNAHGAVVQGFRFRNVGSGGSCARPSDPLACSGNHYPAAIYSDGHHDYSPGADCCYQTTFLIADNVFEENAYGLMLYYRSYGIVMGNVFEGNTTAIAAPAGGDEIILIENNVFANSTQYDIASSASRIFASHNAFPQGLNCEVEYIQRGAFTCNGVVGEVTCDLATLGANGNVAFTDKPDFSDALAQGCFDADIDTTTLSWGDFAGATGIAYESE